MFRDKSFLFTLILGFGTLVSLFLPWADQVSGYLDRIPITYYGHSMPFPNNFFIVLSGVLLLALSIASAKLGVLFRGIGTAFSGMALIPPMYFVISLPLQLPPPYLGGNRFQPVYGFNVGAVLYILIMALTTYSIFSWKHVSFAIFLGLASTLTAYVYSVQQEFMYIFDPSFLRIDHGYPHPWLRHIDYLENPSPYTDYSQFISFNFVFDLVLWFTIAWLLICIFSSLIKIRHRYLDASC